MASKILLIAQLLVGCYEDIESFLSLGQKITVGKVRPTGLECGDDLVPRQITPQRHWRSLIEENAHGLDGGEACFRKLQNREGLLSRDSREPLQKLIDCSAVFEILKQRLHWHASSMKDPRAADLIRGALYRWA